MELSHGTKVQAHAVPGKPSPLRGDHVYEREEKPGRLLLETDGRVCQGLGNTRRQNRVTTEFRFRACRLDVRYAGEGVAKLDKIDDYQAREARTESGDRPARQTSEILRVKLAALGGSNQPVTG